MNYTKAINIYLGKESISGIDYRLLDNSDGNGVQIEFWNIADKPQPTIAELEALQPQILLNDFKENFINLSIGNYRKYPKGYASAVESFNVIYNLVKAYGSLTKEIASQIILYPTPDILKPEQLSEEWLIANQFSPDVMTLEQFMQVYLEFNTKWAAENYK